MATYAQLEAEKLKRAGQVTGAKVTVNVDGREAAVITPRALQSAGLFLSEEEANGAFKLAYHQAKDLGIPPHQWLGLTKGEMIAWRRYASLPVAERIVDPIGDPLARNPVEARPASREAGPAPATDWLSDWMRRLQQGLGSKSRWRQEMQARRFAAFAQARLIILLVARLLGFDIILDKDEDLLRAELPSGAQTAIARALRMPLNVVHNYWRGKSTPSTPTLLRLLDELAFGLKYARRSPLDRATEDG